jgi:hypothetical protein
VGSNSSCPEKPINDPGESGSEWTQEILDKAVRETSVLGVFADQLVEARPVWSVPNKVMIGQVRLTNEPTTFVWIICGDLPTDHINSTVASTAREALRHFSLKWQLDASRYKDPVTRKASGLDETQDWSRLTAQLVAKAEELYAMAEDESLWQHSDSL